MVIAIKKFLPIAFTSFLLSISFLFLLTIHTFCDNSPKPITRSDHMQGFIIDSNLVYENGQFAFSLSQKIWYQDSFLIYEVYTINVNTDTANITTQWRTIDCYRFVDLSNRKYFLFRNFSDTAVPYFKGSHDDPGISAIHQLSLVREVNKIENPIPLSDSVIDNIHYGRYIGKITNNQGSFSVTCHYRKDKRGTIFDMAPDQHTHSNGNPTLMAIYRNSEDHLLIGKSFLYFDRDTLTSDESKTFSAWRKIAEQQDAQK